MYKVGDIVQMKLHDENILCYGKIVNIDNKKFPYVIKFRHGNYGRYSESEFKKVDNYIGILNKK